MVKYRFLSLLIAVACLFVACVDEDSELGLDIVESADRVSGDVFRGTNIEAYTLRDKDLTTSGFRTGVLGSYVDPVFGTTTTAIYSQLSFPNMPLNYRTDNYVLDSAVLTLAYSGQFSRQDENKIRFVISELGESLHPDTVYHANDAKTVINVLYDNTQSVSKEILRSQTTDSTQGLSLRFVLDKELISRLVRDYTDNAEFQQLFKGVKIEAFPVDMSNGGAILYLDFLSPLSHLTLYFKGKEVRKSDRMIFESKGARFIHVDNQFEKVPLNAFQGNDEAKIDGSQKIYIGTLGTTQVRLKLSNLDSLQTRPINRATLILPVSEDLIATSEPPKKLGVFYYQHQAGGDSVLLPVSDAVVSSQHYGGRYDAVKKEYRIRITRYLQNYLNGNIRSPYLYIVADTRKSTANRVVINGPRSTYPRKTALEIIYTQR